MAGVAVAGLCWGDAVVSGPDRGEQHIVRLTDAANGAGEAADMGPARAMRPLEHGLARAL